jgi:hypothetical protein
LVAVFSKTEPHNHFTLLITTQIQQECGHVERVSPVQYPPDVSKHLPFIEVTNSNTLCDMEDKEFLFLLKLTFYQGLREVSVLSRLFFTSGKRIL